MAYTKQELGQELWMLTKGMLQDSRIDADEARVVKRWLEEHQDGTAFAATIRQLDKFLADGVISSYESQSLVEALGNMLAQLRK